MRYALPWLVLGALVLAGCTHVQGQLPSGPNIVTGRATLTEGDYTRFCEDVTLVRATDSIAKKLETFVGSSKGGFASAASWNGVDNEPDFARFARNVTCGKRGEFAFEGVAAGRYYLIARVTWLLRTAHRGGFIIRPIDVSAATNTIDMSIVTKRLVSGKPAGVVEAQTNGQTIIFVGAALGIAAVGLLASSHAYVISPASPPSTQ